MYANFHHLARAIVIKNNHVLLVHTKGEQHTFLPGGHIEFGESAPQALMRELQEELGVDCKIIRFLGLVEHQWEKKGELQCEVNQIFEVEIPNLQDPKSKEPKLEFFWSPINGLHQKQLEPEPLCKLIPEIEKGDTSVCWASTLST